MIGTDDEHMGFASRIRIEGLKPGDVALLRDIAEHAAENAVNKILIAMGLDPSAPLKSQRDFNFLRDLVHDDELQADMTYLRRHRRMAEGAAGKAIAAAVGLAVVGAFGVVWNALRLFVHGLPPSP